MKQTFTQQPTRIGDAEASIAPPIVFCSLHSLPEDACSSLEDSTTLAGTESKSSNVQQKNYIHETMEHCQNKKNG